jgi:hypothetical protein
MQTKNIYSQLGKQYIDRGLSLIPDRYASKKAMIKGYADYCYKLPKGHEVALWSEAYPENNIALCLGEQSGIIALDVDTDDPQILEIIKGILPESPVEKRGSTGFTRFFRYKGEHTQIVKLNGSVVLEVLSSNKKTTLPPSKHPNGCSYVWTTDKTLLDVDLGSLPLLPPFLVSNLESKLKAKFGDLESDGKGSMTSGRNHALSSLCGELIADKVPVDLALKRLVEFDKEQHKEPLFTDLSEMRQPDAFTNALNFYSNHLCTVNVRHYRKNEEMEVPVTASAISQEQAKEADKNKVTKAGKRKKLKEARAVTCPCCGKDFVL